MSNQLLRIATRRAVTLTSQRTVATSTVSSQQAALDPETRDHFHPKLGNRDIVGYGFNGTASYMDRPEFPCPAIRFGENTPTVVALREKEKADWKNLTIDEKKTLYRVSFCRTYAEMNAPTGEWKSVLASVLFALSVTGWVVIWMKKFVYQPMPHTITLEWQEAQQKRMIDQRQGRIEGISSQWDYEKNAWK